MKIDKKILIIVGIVAALVAAGGLVLTFRYGGDAVRKDSREKVRISHYTCPMHPHIHEDKPGACPICQMSLVPVYVEGAAPEGEEEGSGKKGPSVRISPERQQLIGLKTTAVVRQPLRKVIRTVGRVAFDPELAAAQAEFVEIARNVPSLKGAARSRLKIMGMSEEEIRDLEKKGRVASELYLPGKGDSVWVYATLFEGEFDAVKGGAEATIRSAAGPSREWTGTVRAVDPVVDPMTRTVRARIEVPGAGGELKPQGYVDVEIGIDLGLGLSVPKSAVLDTGERKVVFVVEGGREFYAREVKTGAETDEGVVIVEGLEEGEIVVARAAFLVDSESRLKAAVLSGPSAPSCPEGQHWDGGMNMCMPDVGGGK